MSRKIKVKVKLYEFTYKDKKGYHTVVGYGDVPADNPEVKEALIKGHLVEVKPEPTTTDFRKKKKKED